MMIPVFLLKAVAAGVTATLAACSVTNMYETHQLLQTIPTTTCTAANATVRLDPNDGDDDGYTLLTGSRHTSEQVVERLQGMKRKDLLQIFLSSEAPSSIDLIQGQWTGILLDNRSWVMVSATFKVRYARDSWFVLVRESCALDQETAQILCCVNHLAHFLGGQIAV